MYALSIRDANVKGSITFSEHDTWDAAYDELMGTGKWRYVCCFGTGICEFEKGGMVARIYKA